MNQPPLPFTTSPSHVRNIPVLDVCLEMGETEAQIKRGAVPGLGWVLKIQQIIPCLWAPPGLMIGRPEGRLTWSICAGVTFLLATCLVLPSFPTLFLSSV